MKKILIAALSMTAFIAIADDLSPEQRSRLIEISRRESGGLVVMPDPDNGHITIVNMQKRVSETVIFEAVKYVRKLLNLPIVIREKADPSATLTLYIKDQPEKDEISLFAPEAQWGMMNIAHIAKAGTPQATLESRTRKQVARSLAWLCGAGGSQYPNTLVKPMSSAKELDSYKDESLPPDVFARMRVYSEALGIRPLRKVPYRTACQEGWASAPTNEYQKAVWDEVRALPTKPMTIEFDPKRGK